MKLLLIVFLTISYVSYSKLAYATSCFYDCNKINFGFDIKNDGKDIKTSSIESKKFKFDFTDNQANQDSQFWGTWDNDFADAPLLSEQRAKTFYGLGVWLPKKFENEEIDSTTDVEQWLLNHGLQMSLGIINPTGNNSRIRLDYRWQDSGKTDDTISLQFYYPFQ